MIPPSVDELMWLLAEQGEPSAIEAFSKRYPEHHAELLSRVKMLRGLRTVREAPAATAVATFHPSDHISSDRLPMRVSPWLVAAALSCIGLSAYFGTRAFLPSEVASSAVAQIQAPAAPPQNPVAIERVFATDKPAPSTIERIDNPTPSAPETPTTGMKAIVNVVADEERLMQVLNEISLQSGLTFQLAPGLTDSPLSVELKNVPVDEALREIASILNLGFFEQTPGHVLVIPQGAVR